MNGLDRMDVREIQVSDLRIAYRQAGTGPPLVLLHGGMEDSRAWTSQLDGLADEYTVFAWDAPGCGHSTDVPEAWRLPDFADALAAWLRAVDAEHPHVLGLSWGYRAMAHSMAEADLRGGSFDRCRRPEQVSR